MSDIKESFLKKVDELREERLDEISHKTLQSYKSKSLNQIDSMTKNLRSRPGSKDVDVEKLKNRAAGVKLAHKKLKE